MLQFKPVDKVGLSLSPNNVRTVMIEKYIPMENSPTLFESGEGKLLIRMTKMPLARRRCVMIN